MDLQNATNIDLLMKSVGLGITWYFAQGHHPFFNNEFEPSLTPAFQLNYTEAIWPGVHRYSNVTCLNRAVAK